jgi:ABC-2 type transport system permease protein
MPPWLKAIASLNPLTYEVDGLRAMMIKGAPSTFGLNIDFLILAAVFALLVVIAARIYPRMAQ